MQKLLPTLLIVFALGVVGVMIYSSEFSAMGEQSLHEESKSAAVRAGGYLARHIDERGRFDYRYDPIQDEVLDGYNMLRHAGTIYALSELHAETGAVTARDTTERAIEHLVRQIDTCPPPHNASRCVYDGDKAKVGGNALAILALMEYGKATGVRTYESLAVSLAEWLLLVQSPEGEFTEHVVFDDGEVDDHVSAYYPGEAIYALVTLYKERGDEQHLGAAQKAANWLITVRDADVPIERLPHDHWLLYGLNELHAIDQNPLYVEHASKIVQGIIEEQHVNAERTSWEGGFYEPPRTTPTATRAEGLSAAYHIFIRAGRYNEAERTLEALERATRFQLAQHIDERTARSYPNPAAALGGVRESLASDEVRIDYVQHSISALLAYEHIATEVEATEKVR